MNALAPDVACPACGEAEVDVYRQPASKFSDRALPAMLCPTCGYRAVGSAFPRDGVQVELDGRVRLPRPAPRLQPRPVIRPSPPPVAKAPPAPVPQAQPEPEVAPPPPAPPEPEVQYEACSWKDCDEHARPGSKYCSRRCSNKNARYRYANRHVDSAAATAG